MTQNEFVIGLIESEIERDLAQWKTENEVPTDTEKMKEGETEMQDTAIVSVCKNDSE